MLDSTLDGSISQPKVGMITKISLSTMVLSHIGDTTEALPTVMPLILGGDYKATASGTAFEYAKDSGDLLNQFGESRISPTEAGQRFVITLPADSVITAVPEPSSLALGGIGAAGLFGYIWRRQKRSRAKRMA